MIINILSPHFPTAVEIAWHEFKKFRDRRWTRDEKRTRQLTQPEYENIYTGIEFPMDSRYSSLLVTFWMTFMYSSGMPILYLIAFISLFITYWIDKFLCKNHTSIA